MSVARARSRHDTRLVLPALAVWAGAALAVGTGTRGRVLLMALAATGAAVATWRGSRRPGGAHGMRWPHPTAPLALAGAMVLCLGASVVAQDAVREPPALREAVERGAAVEVIARLDGYPRAVTSGFGGSVRAVVTATVLALDGVGGLHAPVVLLLDASEAAPAGSRVAMRAALRPTDPGERAVALVLVRGEVELEAREPPWRRVTGTIRAGLVDATSGLASHAALIPGIALGDDSGVPEPLARAMRTTSLGHLLAVSGAHVAVLLACVMLLAAGFPTPVRLVLGAGTLAGLVALVGPDPSVVRASVMGVVALGALALGRTSAAIPALCSAVVVLVLVDPWIAREPGFGLSVSATAGIVVLSRPMSDWLAPRLGRVAWLAPALALPLAAQVACLPLLVGLDAGLGTYGVPANALVAPVIPPLTVVALAAALVSPFAPGLAHLLARAVEPLTWWIDRVSTVFAGAPLARLPWPPGAVGTGSVMGIALVAGCAWWWGRSRPERFERGVRALARGWPALVGAACAAALVLALVPASRPLVRQSMGTTLPGDWRALACDVGQGSALLVATSPAGGGAHAVMVDVGLDDGAAARCLSEAGVSSVELLVLTHADHDHVGGLAQVLEAVDVGAVLVPPVPDDRLAAALAELSARGGRVQSASSASAPLDVGALRINVLWPTPRALELAGIEDGSVADGAGREESGALGARGARGPGGAGRGAVVAEEASNDLSLTLWITAPDLTVLAHGDLGAAAQARLGRALPADLPAPDVLVVAHHGSRDQDAQLLARTAGRVALISVGAGNRYGHPAPLTLERLSASGSHVLRTDTCGTVWVSRRPDGRLAVTDCAAPPESAAAPRLPTAAGRPAPGPVARRGRLVTVPPARRSTPRGLSWDQAELAPIVLVRGKEALLAERALARLHGLARERAAAQGLTLEVTRLEAAAYEGGRLSTVASPSLFAEPRHIEVDGLEALNAACQSDLLAYLANPAEDVTLVLRHAGGVRGKKVLDALTAAKVPQVVCEEVADREKAAFVMKEFARAHRRIDPAAIVPLVESVGADLRELAASVAQLAADTTGTITPADVERYYGGRVEATGFRVADAAVAGNAGEALALARYAMASGTDPVPLVAALAMKLRGMAKVAASRGRGGPPAGMAPWQVDRAQKDLRGWSPEGLACAIQAVAAADAEVKGASRSPGFAVERAVLRVAGARG